MKSSKAKKAITDRIKKIGVSSHHWIFCEGENIQMVRESENLLGKKGYVVVVVVVRESENVT